MKHQEDILKYAHRNIRVKVSCVIGKYGFTTSDKEDLQQELIVHCLRRLDKYDSRRSAKETFMDRIIINKLRQLIEQRTAQKRDYKKTVSLDEFIFQTDKKITLIDILHLKTLKSTRISSKEIFLRKLDLKQLIESLPKQDQQFYFLLQQGYTVAEASQKLHITIAKARTKLKSLRKLLLEQGIEKNINR
ncbi:MAG: sigma-70 family RNA polymerase sigma factor [Candidatus Auribacter fodinae]|jgi:RNA polymerase sigma-70 factor (ECF subfamily)|uniref:Sigma-70 family RNA polymerase sigma factor n=1 Tax=Candidatus Auribacter fodinae TaxID=2093366 RepID=A0A3A4R8A6_9BACT|nr:MAG: sigma-70 family RNA polymerase sigma factor [Candidatus Auribacter fodinae]